LYLLITFSDTKLDFVEAPALAPPEVELDPAYMANWNAEMQSAANSALPDDDGDDF